MVHICKDDSTARTTANINKYMSTIEVPPPIPSLMTPTTSKADYSPSSSRLNRMMMRRLGECIYTTDPSCIMLAP